jgi:hypothetical protein
VEYLFDILQKIGNLNFLWIEAVGDLRAAKARILELQELTPGEYVVFDQPTRLARERLECCPTICRSNRAEG